MNGVSRGARLWALDGGVPAPVIVLDRGPEGWWVSYENQTDSKGHPRMEQVPARKLYPTSGTAAGALGATR